MIVKLGQELQWNLFRQHKEYVKAYRINEDFLYETVHGWIQGYRGQWLIEIGDRVRIHVDHESFLRSYAVDRRKKERTVVL